MFTCDHVTVGHFTVVYDESINHIYVRARVPKGRQRAKLAQPPLAVPSIDNQDNFVANDGVPSKAVCEQSSPSSLFEINQVSLDRPAFLRDT